MQEDLGIVLVSSFVGSVMESAFLAVSAEFSQALQLVTTLGALAAIASFVSALNIGLDVQAALERRERKLGQIYWDAKKENRLRRVPLLFPNRAR